IHFLMLTRAPGTSRICPSVTTVSPAVAPLASTVSLPFSRDTVTGRTSTVLSGLTTNTYGPCCPVWTAAAGTTTAFKSDDSVTRTLTYWPGHRRRSAFGNVPLTLMV